MADQGEKKPFKRTQFRAHSDDLMGMLKIPSKEESMESKEAPLPSPTPITPLTEPPKEVNELELIKKETNWEQKPEIGSKISEQNFGAKNNAKSLKDKAVDSNLGAKEPVNSEQNLGANCHVSNSLSIPLPKDNNLGAKFGSKLTNNLGAKNGIWEQNLGAKIYPRTPRSLVAAINKLKGIQRVVFNEILVNCAERNSNQTAYIYKDDLAHLADTTSETIENAIKRLIQKGLIEGRTGRRGPGGASTFILNKLVIEIGVQIFPIWEQNLGENLPKISEQKGHISSSNIFNNNNTTTNQTLDLPEEWKDINCSAVAEIGFGEFQLKQLYALGRDPKVIQKSIIHFGWALEEGSIRHKYKDLLQVFYGSLANKGEWHEGKYIQEYKKRMKAIIEGERAAIEEADRLAKEAETLAFNNWKSKLSDSDKLKIVPAHSRQWSTTRETELLKHFKEKVWPELLTEIDKGKI